MVFDVHRVASGEPNAALIDLAADVANAVQPLLRPVDSLAADIRGRESWRGHLSLVCNELLDRADLRDEVEVFIHQLDIAHPSSFGAQLVAVSAFAYVSGCSIGRGQRGGAASSTMSP